MPYNKKRIGAPRQQTHQLSDEKRAEVKERRKEKEERRAETRARREEKEDAWLAANPGMRLRRRDAPKRARNDHQLRIAVAEMGERLKEDREDAGEWEWQSVDEEGTEAWEEKEREKMREREKQETRNMEEALEEEKE
ncbi:hypothetical protein L207DRAFT_627743 [Hyaloscypha variabilis F]|uniref:Uncharacterized protein n=1 Tax=Hyaloscypha variabilis (strain UAMH 11265 / GT02V1 / F) TaxID=1149755 RepID=A0A2J6S8A6_HYAVF|nr:hypothetical protein L207DRAFT_627743 [Hyaloscypha variabilis F]